MKETSTQPAESVTGSSKEIKARPVQLRSVSSLDQAAILMLSMGDDISAGILRNFSREEIISISQAMARRLSDQPTVEIQRMIRSPGYRRTGRTGLASLR